MSFSSDLKGELSRVMTDKKQEQLAEIAGFLRVSASMRLAGGGNFTIVCNTESPAIARHYKKLIKSYFGSTVRLSVGESMVPGKSNENRYILTVSPEEKSQQILRETGLLLIREGYDYLSDGIYPEVVRSKGSKRAYLRGIFLGCGTMSDPRKGYHLEFALTSEQTAQDLRKLIGSFVDLSAKVSQRNKQYVVYMKKADYISDMLALMGAGGAMMDFENIRIYRGQRGTAQRHDNCDYANMDRTLTAAQEQLAWIRAVDAKYGLENLPPELREVARVRMEQPEASLAEIGEALNPPIKKPGVSKRFARLRDLAASEEQR
ncbi:MAG: DNA-binding protein WhiA [Mogibacterium sp.]|nr:DNA-binding protein WhiA [Mogibacterium sp.]